ncbi:MAG TPA: Crp/Fnr family transcriptional regulator [Candidatus Saccharimonadales bacterium]|nr:Crp/Fnr family transcriptional regulator [Candidatus Saccharimonadales bacterium]
MFEQTVMTLQDFLKGYVVKSYRKGEIIIFQGEAPRTVSVVKNGIIKVYNLNHNGDEKPVGFQTEGEIFPAPWAFYKAPSALYYYEALTDVELYHVPRDDYLQFLKRTPDELYSQLERMITDYLGSMMRLNALQHSRAADKLVYTLHYLALSQGKRISEEEVEIMLDLTHQDFANLTGLTRETAATELNKLKSMGIISYGKHIPYRIKIKKLNAALNDQSVAEVQLNK